MVLDACTIVCNIWEAWKACYLQSLQARTQWNDSSQIKVNNLVYVKDETLTTRRWPFAKVVATHPGPDGCVRAVDILYGGRTRVARPFTQSRYAGESVWLTDHVRVCSFPSR